MDREDERYFNELVKNFKEVELKKIAEDCLKLFRESIDEAVYDSYTPTWYPRTRQLINSAKYKIENDTLFVYIDTDDVTYHSWVTINGVYTDTGKEVGSIVPYLVESGHMGRHTEESENQYNNYEPRYYLERAKMKIDRKYGVSVEIINDKPQWI